MSETTHDARDSAKQRARRIPLDYYKRLTGLEATKWILTALASLAAGAYVLWTLSGWLVGTRDSARQFSPGPVASAHAVWDADCATCHVPGTNLRHDAAGISLISSLVGGRAASDHSHIDRKCQSCHSGEVHHSSQIASEVLSCAGCHHDHQGRDANIARVADAVCTACHANLKAHRRAESKSALGGQDSNITAFNANHPPFRSLTSTAPGKLKFNHKLHMLPGQYAQGSTAAGKKKLSDIPEAYRARLVAPRKLADVPADEVVQLDCGYCHVPDDAARSAAPKSGASVPAAGSYMQPINFERHCAACHNGELVAEVQVAEQVTAKQLPHGIKAAAIRELLTGLASPPAGPPRISPAQPLVKIPGKTPGENLAQTTQLDAATRVADASVRLMGEARCGKCHTHEKIGELLPSEVLPPNLPSVWLPHSRFDHAAHRAMQCYECHDRNRLVTTEAGVKPGLDAPQPMIDDIDKCQQCHARTTKWGTPGARHDCAECHRYHGGERPPHGRGDPRRGVPVDKRHKAGGWMRAGVSGE